MEARFVGTLGQVKPLFDAALSAIENPMARTSAIEHLMREWPTERVEGDGGEVLRRVDPSILAPKEYYAIHDEDLAVVKECGIVAGGAYVLFQNPVAIIGGLVALLYRYRRKRAKLSEKHATVLIEMKSDIGRGWSAEELASSISYLEPPKVSEIVAVLNDLAEFRLSNGEITKFVDQKDGLWWVVDV